MDSKHSKILCLLRNVRIGSILILKQKTLKNHKTVIQHLLYTPDMVMYTCLFCIMTLFKYYPMGFADNNKNRVIYQMMVYHCGQCTVNRCFVIYLMHQVATAMCVFHSLFFHSGFEHHSRLHSERLWPHCTNK